MKNLVIITPHYPLSYSGASKQNHKINIRLISHLKISVLSPNNATNTEYDGIPIVRLPRFKRIDIKKRMHLVIWLFRSIIHIIMKHKNYDVALLLGAYIDNVALLPVLHLFGIKTILKTTIASGEFLANSFTQKVKSSLIVRSVDQFIVLNDELRNELVNIGVDLKKINIIPNGIEIKTEFKVRNNEQKMVFSTFMKYCF